MGTNNHKLTNFQIEQGMQKLNPTLVRCIAFTTESPWVTVFPFFNGGTVNDILCSIPCRESNFRFVVERLEKGEYGFRPNPDIILDSVQLDHVKSFTENMTNVMHAMADGMRTAHGAGIVHCDLHSKNVVLDFTKENKVRVGIIDWGLLLRAGVPRPSITFVNPSKCDRSTIRYCKAER